MSESTITEKAEPFFSVIDTEFAQLLRRIDTKAPQALEDAARLVSRSARLKNSCFDLDHLEQLAAEYGEDQPFHSRGEIEKALKTSKVIGDGNGDEPLVIRGSRIYLSRYFQYEKTIVREIERRINQYDPEALVRRKSELDAFFEVSDGEIDWQKCAAANALARNFSAITGGPGTGKTTTVVRAVLLYAYDRRETTGKIPSIALASPTGKASAHMRRSVENAIHILGKSTNESVRRVVDATSQSIANESFTLHRLMNLARNTGVIPFDCVVVDECSMADLSLFARFLEKLRPQAKCIVVGDKDQLSSVEAGSVMGDLCARGGEIVSSEYAATMKTISIPIPKNMIAAHAKPIHSAVTSLKTAWRFDSKSGIAQLADLINAGKGIEAYELLSTEGKTLSWMDIESKGESVIRRIARERSSEYKKNFNTPEALIAEMSEHQILCAHRRGSLGSIACNEAVERFLRADGIAPVRGRFYHGKPLIITENDHPLRLYNGDTGVVCRTGNELRAFFSDGSHSLRNLHPVQIRSAEPAYALTVHKSQGSEYNNVTVILADNDSPIVTRELLYTAVTRARTSIRIIGKKDLFISACGKRTGRDSGLAEMLWGD